MSVYRPTYRDPKTGKQKKPDVWWYEFVYTSKRIRESAKTTRKTVAAEAEKDHRLSLERAHAGMHTEAPKQRIRTVAEVLKTYEAQYGINHRDNSLIIVANRSKHLTRKLGSALLPDLDQARLVECMEQRRQERAGNRTINIELMVLSRAIGLT
jgi:(p)ppGpp synthase/HD superfamily hydrolase